MSFLANTISHSRKTHGISAVVRISGVSTVHLPVQYKKTARDEQSMSVLACQRSEQVRTACGSQHVGSAWQSRQQYHVCTAIGPIITEVKSS